MTTEVSQWTIETLKEYVVKLIEANDIRYNQRFDASQSAINTALIAQQTAMQTALTAQRTLTEQAQNDANRAVTKAEIATEKRFESVNEFREALATQQRTLITRTEIELIITGINEKLDNNSTAITGMLGQKTGKNDTLAYIFGIVGMVVGVVGIIMALAFHV